MSSLGRHLSNQCRRCLLSPFLVHLVEKKKKPPTRETHGQINHHQKSQEKNTAAMEAEAEDESSTCTNGTIIDLSHEEFKDIIKTSFTKNFPKIFILKQINLPPDGFVSLSLPEGLEYLLNKHYGVTDLTDSEQEVYTSTAKQLKKAIIDSAKIHLRSVIVSKVNKQRILPPNKLIANSADLKNFLRSNFITMRMAAKVYQIVNDIGDDNLVYEAAESVRKKHRIWYSSETNTPKSTIVYRIIKEDVIPTIKKAYQKSGISSTKITPVCFSRTPIAESKAIFGKVNAAKPLYIPGTNVFPQCISNWRRLCMNDEEARRFVAENCVGGFEWEPPLQLTKAPAPRPDSSFCREDPDRPDWAPIPGARKRYHSSQDTGYDSLPNDADSRQQKRERTSTESSSSTFVDELQRNLDSLGDGIGPNPDLTSKAVARPSTDTVDHEECSTTSSLIRRSFPLPAGTQFRVGASSNSHVPMNSNKNAPPSVTVPRQENDQEMSTIQDPSHILEQVC